MKVKELNEYLHSLCSHQIKESESVDAVTAGDSEIEIRGIATCWMPTKEALETAFKAGINVIVTHEPVFYNHFEFKKGAIEYYEKEIQDKDNWINKHNMAVIRCHDVLDAMLGWGIPFAFTRALGFSEKDVVREKLFARACALKKPVKAKIAAEMIAKRLKVYGQEAVQFYGDPERIVRIVAFGTGCYSNPRDLSTLQPDLYISVGDAVRTWVETVWAADTGNPLVVIDHGTSEEPGVRELSKHLKEKFKEFKVIHLVQGCLFKLLK